MAVNFGIDKDGDFMKELEKFCYRWDAMLILIEKNCYGSEHCNCYIHEWDLIKAALIEITGIDFSFTRTDEYYGICTEDEDFLIRIERRL